MNIRDLNYFVILAKTKHFGEAARQSFISQPTLSMQIKKLEDELGILLFERDNKRVMLTEGGQKLLGRAQQILSLVSEMKEMAKSVSDPYTGELRLGVIPTVAPYLLPLVMSEIQTEFPALKLWLIEDKTHNLVDRLHSGDLDAAIMAVPAGHNLIHQELYEEPFYFACANNSPLAVKQVITLDQLAHQPVMLLEEGHCLREQAMSICQSVEAATPVNFSATSLETLRLMVQSGVGVTLMPALAVKGNDARQLKILPFENASPSRHIALFWRETSVRTVCLQALANLITSKIKILLPG